MCSVNDVAVPHLELPLEKSGVRLVTDGDEEPTDFEGALCPGDGVLELGVCLEVDDGHAAVAPHLDPIGAGAKDYWDHTRIQVSMFGKSSGSKFAQSHAE